MESLHKNCVLYAQTVGVDVSLKSGTVGNSTAPSQFVGTRSGLSQELHKMSCGDAGRMTSGLSQTSPSHRLSPSTYKNKLREIIPRDSFLSTVGDIFFNLSIRRTIVHPAREWKLGLSVILFSIRV